MVQISFLTLTDQDAVELAKVLNERRLLLFDTIEEHVDLIWDGERPAQRKLTHLSGMTKALLYSTVEHTAMELLGERVVRIWAQPVTCLDPRSTALLLDWTAKV